MKDQLLHFIERAEGDIAFLNGSGASPLDKALAEHLIEYVSKLKEIAQ